MKGSRFNEEQIIGVLREHEAGAKPDELCRRHGISSATLYKWKAKYGGLEVSEARRLKALEDENRRLKKLLGRVDAGQRGAQGPARKKRLEPAAQRATVSRLMERHGLSHRCACRLMGWDRSTMWSYPFWYPIRKLVVAGV